MIGSNEPFKNFSSWLTPPTCLADRRAVLDALKQSHEPNSYGFRDDSYSLWIHSTMQWIYSTALRIESTELSILHLSECIHQSRAQAMCTSWQEIVWCTKSHFLVLFPECRRVVQCCLQMSQNSTTSNFGGPCTQFCLTVPSQDTMLPRLS